MAQTTFSIRMDENLKRQFDALCVDFGMNVTTAFTIFAKTVVREREIPFKIAAPDPFYSGANWRHITAAIEEFYDPSKPKIVKTMEELEAMANE
ncbi:MAG: type II toxin-antitoxin system RelB/DinJ family antitoxin [Oscillospiraceae bacterium]|nr:type II toxin-antitoxin system RelB/DinJ family antitoxin [Oscillospiraceae bacterium]